MGEYPVWFLFQCLTASRYSLSEWCPSPLNSFWESAFPSLFYCAHWQTYVSGTLQFGYIDVTEGQLVVMGVMLISSLEDFLDIDIWMSSVSTCPRFWPPTTGFLPQLYFFTLNQLVTLFGVGCGIYSMFKVTTPSDSWSITQNRISDGRNHWQNFHWGCRKSRQHSGGKSWHMDKMSMCN